MCLRFLYISFFPCNLFIFLEVRMMRCKKPYADSVFWVQCKASKSLREREIGRCWDFSNENSWHVLLLLLSLWHMPFFNSNMAFIELVFEINHLRNNSSGFHLPTLWNLNKSQCEKTTQRPNFMNINAENDTRQ